VRGVLGGDRIQRRAFDVINEICSFRSMRIWKDADTDEWMMLVDGMPSHSGLTFEFGPTTSAIMSQGNAADIDSITTTPLGQAVSALKLRYHIGGRDRGGKNLEQTDYAYTCQATVLGLGRERIITNPWLRGTSGHLEAARVLYYQAKRLAREDTTVVFRARHQGRRVDVGDLVTLAFRYAPDQNLAGDYRIIQRERTLTEYIFTAAGPHDNDIYTTTEGTITSFVTSPSGDLNPDEREGHRGNDGNLVVNADFSSGLVRQSVVGAIDSDILPNWTLFNCQSTYLASLSVERSSQAKGGAYLECVTQTAPLFQPELSTLDSAAPLLGSGVSVTGDINYILSIFANRQTAWRFVVLWFNASNAYISTSEPAMSVAPGDVNGLGYKRYYSVVTAPGSAVYAGVGFRMAGSTSGTVVYRWDGVQFEEVTRLTPRPTPWHRNARYGVEPTYMLPGFHTVRATGEREHGTKTAVNPFGGLALAGAGTVTLGTAAVGLLTGLTGRVTAGISGPAIWTLALNYGGGTIQTLTVPLGTAVNTTIGDADAVFSSIPLTTATPIVAIAASGSFTGGAVKVSTHMLHHIAPTT